MKSLTDIADSRLYNINVIKSRLCLYLEELREMSYLDRCSIKRLGLDQIEKNPSHINKGINLGSIWGLISNILFDEQWRYLFISNFD